jgi:hypothetical protein
VRRQRIQDFRNKPPALRALSPVTVAMRADQILTVVQKHRLLNGATAWRGGRHRRRLRRQQLETSLLFRYCIF